MIGRIHVYAWDDAGRVYRHLGSLPGEEVADALWTAGNTIRLVPPARFMEPPPDPAEAHAPAWVEGLVTPLAGIGLALVVTPAFETNLPLLPGWTPRAKAKAKAAASETAAEESDP